MTPMLTPTLLAALGPILALPGAVTETIARLPQIPDFTGALNDIAGSWGDAIGRASWQAGLLAAGAWAVTRLWGKRLPASVTATLWWLVAAKVLVALIWATPVGIPVLQATGPTALSASGGNLAEHVSPLTAVLQTGNVGGKGGRRGGSLAPAPTGIKTGAAAATAGNSAASTASATAVGSSATAADGGTPPGRSMPTPLTMLFCLWSAGVLCHAGLALRQFQAARALVARAVPLSGASGLTVQREVDQLAERMGLPQGSLPEVRISHSIAGPLLIGLSRNPVILLPAHLLPPPDTALSPEELRLVLAHEMAHLRRFDPLLGLIPALASALLFFHPLVRLASREFDIARESACDAAALAATNDAPGRYAQLLLKLGVLGHSLPLGGVLAGRPGRPAPAGTLAAVSEFAPLRRRLVLLQQLLTREGRNAATPTRRQRVARYLVFVFIGTVGLVPWRMVAAPPPAGEAGAAATAAIAPGPGLGPAAPAATVKKVTRQQRKSVRVRSTPASAPAARRLSAAAARQPVAPPTTAARSTAHGLPAAPAARALDLEPGTTAVASGVNPVLAADAALAAGPVLSLRPPAAAEHGVGVAVDTWVLVSAPQSSGHPSEERVAVVTPASGGTVPVAEALEAQHSARSAALSAEAEGEARGSEPASLIWIVPTFEGFALALGVPFAEAEAAARSAATSHPAQALAEAASMPATPAEAAAPTPFGTPEGQTLNADEGTPRTEEEVGGEKESLPSMMPPPESFAPLTLSSISATETRRGVSGCAANTAKRSLAARRRA